jgi:uncharacterized MAPEG superfamily protein
MALAATAWKDAGGAEGESRVTTELMLLGWSVILLLAYTAVQGGLETREKGLAWNAGARDGYEPPKGAHAGRARRALENFKETYPAFVGLALAVTVADTAGGLSAWGAGIWFVARIVYLPLYVFGVPYVRSLVFGASMVGLILMLVALLTGGGAAP